MTPAGWTQTCTLVGTQKPGEYFPIRLDMKLSGELRIRKDDEIEPLKLKASAVHEYPKRLLVVAPDGLAQKAARLYDTAEARITAGGDRNKDTSRSLTFLHANGLSGMWLITLHSQQSPECLLHRWTPL